MCCNSIFNFRIRKCCSAYFLLFFVSFFVWGESHATPLSNGSFISEEISVIGEVDLHTFDASPGDYVFLRVADTETTQFINSSFFPLVQLIDPNGTFVTQSSGALVGDISTLLTVEGQYQVLISDASSGNDETGSYDLHFTLLAGANEGGSLPNGENIEGFITLGDVDSFTFNATAGEYVYLRAADTETTEFINSSFFPFIALFSPTGSLITQNSGALVADISELLIEDGIYTVVINDESSGEDAIGSYNLYYSKISGANEGGVLLSGESQSDFIDLADIDSYTFTANAGETVFIRVADKETTQFINSGFFPFVALHAPDSSRITSASGALVADVSTQLTQTGTYTIIVNDESSGEDAIGAYELFYTKAPVANEGCGIGTNAVTGMIDLGDIDSYAFSTSAPGEFITVSLTDTNGDAFFPFVGLYDSSGAVITTRSNANVATFSTTLPSAGDFYLIVTDESSGEDAIGNYQLQVAGNVSRVACSALMCNGLVVTVNLADGDVPTSGSDVIYGTSGPDIINALGGNDTICSGSGADIINGGGGDDWISSDAGSDVVFGGGGNDAIFGGAGGDEIDGGGGDDEIFGGNGADILSGRSGEDIIDGGDGIDQISGGPSADTIYSGRGATVGSGSFVSGGAGADLIFGDDDADDLRGGSGADEIRGNGGDDVITGGIGRDLLYGNSGDDMIRGQDSVDELFGGSGNDELFGGAGNDNLTGGSGTDTCNGQGGSSDVAIGGCETEIGFP